MLKKLWVLRDANGVPGGVVDPAADPNAAPVVDPNAAPVVDPNAVDPNASLDDDDKPVVPRAALIDERKKRQERDVEIAFLKGQLSGGMHTQPAKVEEPHVPQSPTAPVEPTQTQFGDDWEAYDRAMAQFRQQDREYIVAKTKFELTQEFDQRMAAGKQKQTAEQFQAAFESRLQKEAESDPEILMITQMHHIPGPYFVPLSPSMGEAITESEVGPKILRYLANNKAEATRIASLTGTSAIREIGKIEAAIMNTKPEPVQHVTAAPEPVKVPGGGGDVVVDEDNLPFAEYLARERAKKFAKRT